MASQLKFIQRPDRSSALILAEGGIAWDAHLAEAIENVGDFLRFVDGTNRSEISSEEVPHVAFMKRRFAGRRVARAPGKGARQFWCNGLALIFGLMRRAEVE
jgi:hypothetical protein